MLSLAALRRLVAITLLLSACGGSPSKAGGGGTGDAGGDGAASCGTCGANQVCVDGACVNVPSMCPCPKESYCDLATNRCMIGCTSDEGCSAGRICLADQRSCVAGCRDDTACATGQICENLQCVAGCRDDSTCGLGRICKNLQCVPGCRTDDSQCEAGLLCVNQACIPGCRADGACAAGQICQNLQCVAGCRSDATCGTGTICENLQCVPGCRADAGCPAGQICVGTTCQAGCRDYTTCPAGQVCDAAALTCRNCAGNSECPPPTPICNAAGHCSADTRTCTTDANCNTAIKEVCFNGKCYASGQWSPCRNSTAQVPSCTGTQAVVTNSTVTPRACYCSDVRCTADTDCAPPASGTATPACVTSTLNFCRLDCSGGKTCPFAMTCIGNSCYWM
jgi:hypothetical protein